MAQDNQARLESLQARHREYEARLAALEKQRWLSDEEQREETELKKRKLRLKDEMERLRSVSP